MGKRKSERKRQSEGKEIYNGEEESVEKRLIKRKSKGKILTKMKREGKRLTKTKSEGKRYRQRWKGSGRY
jgi:hypothetical protein